MTNELRKGYYNMGFLIDFVKQLTSLTNGQLLNILLFLFGITAGFIAFHSDWFHIQLSGLSLWLISCFLSSICHNCHYSFALFILEIILGVLWMLVLGSLFDDLDKQNGRYNASSKDLHFSDRNINCNSNSNNSNVSNFDNSN